MRDYLSKKLKERATRWVLAFFFFLIVIIAIGRETSSRTQYGRNPSPENAAMPQNVAAQSYLIANMDTGQIYAEKNEGLIYPMASITKLMTAIVASNTMNMSSSLTITPLALTLYGNKEDFQYGERLTMDQLFYFLLMESDNTVAETISMSIGDSTFVKEMNAEAQKLGLDETAFTDSTGLDTGDRSTVTDIFHLAQYISAAKPFIWQITASPDRTINDSGYIHLIQSANLFSADPRFVGGKVGYTGNAAETMVALFNLPVAVGSAGAGASGKTPTTQTIAFIVLDSQARDADIGKLLEWFELKY